MIELLKVFNNGSAIVLAFITGGGLIAFFKYLTNNGSQGLRNKAQDLAGFKVYTEKLEARITLLERRLDEKEILYREEIIRKDKVIDVLQTQVSKLTAEVEIQANTILNLQTQITAHHS